MRGEGQRQPVKITSKDRLLHCPPLLRRGVFQEAVDEPGAGRPDKAMWAFPRLAGEIQCGRDVLAQILLEHACRKIGKTDVEVRLKDDRNVLDGLSARRRSLHFYRLPEAGVKSNAARVHQDESSPLHSTVC